MQAKIYLLFKVLTKREAKYVSRYQRVKVTFFPWRTGSCFTEIAIA